MASRPPDPARVRLLAALRQELSTLPFPAYAACIELLLQRMGYTDVTLGRVTPHRACPVAGDPGLSARAETGLTRTRVVAQLKNGSRLVHRRFVDELRGAMLRTGARQGLLITTSSFSQAARQAARADRTAPIRLLDGAALTRLLLAHGVGVQRSETAETGEGRALDTASLPTCVTVSPPHPRVVATRRARRAGRR